MIGVLGQRENDSKRAAVGLSNGTELLSVVHPQPAVYAYLEFSRMIFEKRGDIAPRESVALANGG